MNYYKNLINIAKKCNSNILSGFAVENLNVVYCLKIFFENWSESLNTSVKGALWSVQYGGFLF